MKSSAHPKLIDRAKLADAVKLAQQTSVCNAERAMGISCSSIRNEMKRLGIKRRPVGSFSSKELDRIGGKIVP